MNEAENLQSPTGYRTWLAEKRDLPPLAERPDPDWVRGDCPLCGEVLVSNMQYSPDMGYLVVWTCWRNTMTDGGDCDFRKVL